MEPNYLDELKKLKEQKDADLSKSQPYNSPSIPDFEEASPAEAPAVPETPSDETIKFEPVTTPSDEPSASTAGRRARRPSPEEIARRKRKKKIKLAVIISAASLAVILAALLQLATQKVLLIHIFTALLIIVEPLIRHQLVYSQRHKPCEDCIAGVLRCSRQNSAIVLIREDIVVAVEHRTDSTPLVVAEIIYQQQRSLAI